MIDTIEGSEVALTPLRDDDSEKLYEWINDRELVTLNAPFKPVSRESHRRWFEQVRNRCDVRIFAIRLLADDRLIGSCQLNEIDRDGGSCRLQIRIGERSKWNRGHGSEAVGLLVRHALDGLGLSRVRLDVFADNERALRAYEKAGFTRLRQVQGRALIEGKRKDVIEMELQRGG